MKRSYSGLGEGHLPSKMPWPHALQDDTSYDEDLTYPSFHSVSEGVSFEYESNNFPGRARPKPPAFDPDEDYVPAREFSSLGDVRPTAPLSHLDSGTAFSTPDRFEFGRGASAADYLDMDRGRRSAGQDYPYDRVLGGEGTSWGSEGSFGLGRYETPGRSFDWNTKGGGRDYAEAGGYGRGHGFRGQGVRAASGGWGGGADWPVSKASNGGAMSRGRTSRGQDNKGRGQRARGRGQGGRGALKQQRAGNNFMTQGLQQQQDFYSPRQQQQPQQGRGGGARGFGGRGRGQVKGRGRGGQMPQGGMTTAGQVKHVSDNILKMLKGTAGQGRGQGRGQGKGRGRGFVSKPASLQDLVDTAWQRKFGKAVLSDEDKNVCLFLDFLKTWPDRVNGIQTIGNALTASHVTLAVTFEAEELMFILKPIFTGVLKMGSYFLTRGLGLSKKAVKHDCFERAVGILRQSSLEDIQKLEDCGMEALKTEVQRQSEEDFDAFKSFLFQKQAAEVETSEKIRTAAVSATQVAERHFPLADKIMMLLKEVNKTARDEKDVSIASRYDVLCFKVGISVAALFRAVNPADARQFVTAPYKGDPDLELICEIYYDEVMVGQGQGRPRKAAQLAAYKDIQQRLSSEVISDVVQGRRLPPQPETLDDFFEVQHKGSRPQEGHNHSRLYSLRAYPPDLSAPVQDMVVMEMVGDNVEENAYKILEYSASRNGMLLHWKQLDRTNTGNGFRCEITLNGQKTVVGMESSKPKARNAAAAMILMEMYQMHDVISFQTVDDFSSAHSMSDIRARAEVLASEGPPRRQRVDCPWPSEQADCSWPADAIGNRSGPDAGQARARWEEEAMLSAKAWVSDPLRLWMEDAITELFETRNRKISLEDVVIGPGVTQALRRFSYMAGRHFGHSITQKVDGNKDTFLTFHPRALTPQEMVKILHINPECRSRYKLLRANRPFTATSQAHFVRTFPDVWRERIAALNAADKPRRGAPTPAAIAAPGAVVADHVVGIQDGGM